MQTPIFSAAAIGLMLVMGCGDSSRPTQPSTGTSVTSGSGDKPGAGEKPGAPAGASLPARQILMMDACDPTTFDANVEPGTCVGRHGGVKFDQFIAELTLTQKAGAWHFAPPNTTAREGQTLLATNNGGEVHTFTRVSQFGGGLVPDLNRLSGNLQVATECTQLDDDDFVPPGGTYEEEVGSEDTQLFECCIHPWMRMVIHTH
ncbi:MAG TPA: hypothetical protein VL853_09190 [Gemmatimonadales bacterium]|nr:hypothetical protein [Gemmatimonadales bacterium]